jgi:hypothetical protein
MTRLTDIEYMYHTVPRICLLIVNTLRSFPHSSLNIGFVFKVIRQVPPVEKELLTFPEHMSSPPVFRGVRVAQSLICCVVFCGSLSFCLFLLVIVLLSVDLRFVESEYTLSQSLFDSVVAVCSIILCYPNSIFKQSI